MGYSKDHVAGCLRANRARIDKSRDVVASESGVPSATLGDYERGKTGVSLENAWKLADYYGKSMDDLFERKTS